jgi:hypothetical protein
MNRAFILEAQLVRASGTRSALDEQARTRRCLLFHHFRIVAVHGLTRRGFLERAERIDPI